MEEIWKPVIGYDWYYEVSSLWNVKSTYFWKGKILSPAIRNWYKQVCFCIKWKKKTIYVHIIVAQAFIPNPDHKPQVNHINWIRSDSNAINLEWVTASENILHSFKVLWRVWSNLWNKWARKILLKYSLDLHLLEEYDWMWEFCKINWYDQWFISRCCRTWAKWYWFYWKIK